MKKNHQDLVSIVLPVYNEEANVETAYAALLEVIETIDDCQFEFIFTDNHSQDRTYELLAALADKDKRVRVLRFNRNYGFQRSLMSGYRLAKGDAVVQIDCDLQDPPELIAEFIKLWRQGHDVVVGIRKNRKENRLLSFGRRCFYALIDYVADEKIPRDAGDFRLIDRSVLNKLVHLNDVNPYIRGLSSAFSTNETGIPFERRKRMAGESKFPLRRLLKLASDGVFSLTLFPLRLAGHVSLLVSLITCCLGAYYLISALFFGADWPSGFATLVLLLLFSIGLNGTFLAIMGKYLGQMFLQQQNRPYIVIQNSLNVEADEIGHVESSRRGP